MKQILSLRMKNVRKRTTALSLALVMLLVSVLAIGSDAQAAKQSYMDKLGVKWGIEQGKAYTFTHMWPGVGKKKFTWTISNVKVKSVKNKKYKKLTYTETYKTSYKPSAYDVGEMYFSGYWNTHEDLGYTYAAAFVDAKTGKDLEKENDLKVKFTYKDQTGTVNTYKAALIENEATDGENPWISFPESHRYDVTVVYPAKYDDFCIGIMGANFLLGDMSQKDKNFFEGKVPFGKTQFYTKGKKNSRWVMVSDLVKK